MFRVNIKFAMKNEIPVLVEILGAALQMVLYCLHSPVIW